MPAWPAEGRERLAADLRRRLASWPLATRVLRYSMLGSVAAVLLACLFVKGYREGLRVWLPCLLMLLAWTAILPTRTMRWPSVTRLFTLATLWALVVTWLSARLAQVGSLTPSAAGPRVAIAGFVEETFKLLPLAVLAAVAPGRVRRFAVADWLLCGLASGMGFQAAEDFVRQATYRPGLLDFLVGRRWAYGWTLFGGSFDNAGHAAFPGHHVTTALVAAGIGLAIHATLRRRRAWWPLVWLVPAILWIVVVCDHLAYNAVGADARYSKSTSSRVPQIVHDIWAATGVLSGGTTLVIPAAVSTGAGIVVAGTGTVMMTAGAASGAGSEAGGSESGGRKTGDGQGSAADEARLEELAKDPAHGGKISDKTIQEARVGLEAEARGDLPGPITRDPSGAAEFIDGQGELWDVKGFNTDYANGYDLGSAMEKIGRSIDQGENVLLDPSKMNSAAIDELRGAVEARSDWIGKVVWGSPR